MMGAPNFLCLAMLWVWPAIAAALFASLPPRRALAVGFVIGWLFLPMLSLPMPFVKYDKHAATSLGAILGVIMFDPKRLTAFKPGLIDLPMIVWCVVPFSATMSNTGSAGLTPYTGLSAAATEIIKWGVPYYLGRVYYGDPIGLRGLAVWTLIAGVLYIPFCFLEIAISPQLHFMVYGFYQHEFTQVIRMGGYRPMVFLQHGIAVGNMMAGATLVGFWLWWTGSLKTLFNMPAWVSVMAVLGTTLAVKSTGALLLTFVGIGALFATKMFKNQLVLIVLCVGPFLYMGARSVGGWDGENLVGVIASAFGEDRSLSLKCRFDNENILLAKAMQKPLFGWGPNGNNLVLLEDGVTISSIPDGQWVIAIGACGIVGLIALFTALSGPTLAVMRRVKATEWATPLAAGVAAFAVLLPIHAIDMTQNAMANPLFLLGLGGLAGYAGAPAATAITGRQSQRQGYPVMLNRQGVA
ncbi:MAG: O-antigen ligase domain-containing protein [Phycisphaerae bacterium]|nr:hypothetical protein [Tepidisphaeraceae bacterium]